MKNPVRRERVVRPLAVVALLLGFGLLTACSRVESGRIVSCKVCRKDIVNDVRSQTVPVWDKDKDKYSVARSEEYCAPCGDEPISYRIQRKCQRCGATYSDTTAFAARRTEPKDQVETAGYCGEACSGLASLEHGVDRGSQAVGSFIGRVGAGIASGILRHAR